MPKLEALFAILLFSGATGCANKVADVGCLKKLSENIRVGVSEALAERALDQCGYSHSFDPNTDTIISIKRGEQTGAIRQNWSVRVNLDEARNVKFLKVERVFTGP